MLKKFFTVKSQKGVTMIEYALIAALVAVVAITGLTTLGTDLSALFTTVAGKL
ncbi:MAG: Flp family type IVb pilin [Chlorobiaceae bacterium]